MQLHFFLFFSDALTSLILGGYHVFGLCLSLLARLFSDLPSDINIWVPNGLYF
jgi:hypothetical protein